MEQTDKSLKIYRASAGSGKTFRLAVEYITLLVVNPMEYQSILAVTFTNKATAEMKQRILSTLYGIAVGLEDADKYVGPILKNIEGMKAMPQHEDDRMALAKIDRGVLRVRAKEALSNIIHDYSRFRVETIDSFFQGIVREIANELELSANMKIEIDETEVLSDAVDDIIDNLDERSNEFRTIVEFIEEKIRSNRSWQVNDTVKSFGRNIFKENYLIHGEDVRRRITNYDSISKYRNKIRAFADGLEAEVADMGRKFFEAYGDGDWGNCAIKKSIVTFFEKVRDRRVVEPKGSSKGTYSEAIEKFRDSADEWLNKSCKNRDVAVRQVESVLMPILRETFDRHDEYVKHRQTVDAIAQHLYSLTLLNEISDRVKALNNDANRFLLSETANFLRNVINDQNIPFIYEKTGSVIKHIMIDEFQDTSTLQWGNFRPLLLNSLSSDGSGLIVGDVKQSIYRFRNSDWQILNNINDDDELKCRIGEIPAEYNYRSSKNVVDFNNDLFKNAIKLLATRCKTITTAYKDVRQKTEKSEKVGYVKVENINYHSIKKDNVPEPWDKKTPADYGEAMLQRVQLSVKELVDNGVNVNDITILIRTNKEVAQISEYFATHADVLDVKVVSDDAFRLDASPSVNIIICALRVLASNDDKLHLATLAYSYQAEVLKRQDVKDDLSAIFLCDKTDDIDSYLPNKFRRWERRDMQFMALTEQIERIYQIFQLHRIDSQDAYMFFLNDLAEQFCEDNLTDLDSFLQAWDEKLCCKTIPNGAADGVRVMTMHKSKGLEFHSVIIPSCSWKIEPKNTEVIWCEPKEKPYSDMPLLPISVSKATERSIFADDREDEELRTLVDNVNVLYVAFTRAKNNLVILTGNKIGETVSSSRDEDDDLAQEPNADVAISTAQEFLVNAMPEDMTQTDYEGIVTIYEYGKILPTESEQNSTDDEEEVNVMECDYAPRVASFNSYPAMATFRQSYESDLFITSDSLNLDVQRHNNRIRLISLGNLYHNIFQHVHTIDDVPHAVNLLQSKGCFGTILEAGEAQSKVTELIEGVSAKYPEWYSPEWAVINERTILHVDKQNSSDGKKEAHPVSYRPDRVIVSGDRAIIIDYKTARGVVKMLPSGMYSAPDENKTQIKKYAKLLRQIGYKDIQAYLWYILDDIVCEVSMDFDSENIEYGG